MSSLTGTEMMSCLWEIQRRILYLSGICLFVFIKLAIMKNFMQLPHQCKCVLVYFLLCHLLPAFANCLSQGRGIFTFLFEEGQVGRQQVDLQFFCILWYRYHLLGWQRHVFYLVQRSKLSLFYSDRFTFSYAKDGKLRMEIKSAVPTDAGVYKCTVWGKKAGTARTKARMLVGGEQNGARSHTYNTYSTCRCFTSSPISHHLLVEAYLMLEFHKWTGPVSSLNSIIINHSTLLILPTGIL